MADSAVQAPATTSNHDPAHPRFLVACLGGEPVTVIGVYALHDLLTSWFVDAPIAQLALVDELAAAVLADDYDQHELAVALGLDVDRIGDAG